jgi:EAL domain-containing protein (putative c-di-GMP-specific phosphodiesterase class I)
MEEPCTIGNLQLRVTASLGAVISDDASYDNHDYLRAADMALYLAKAEGRNCYRFFSIELDDALRRRDRLETDLRGAIRSGRGVGVHFQPQIDARGELTGVETLFRWRHPYLGDIAPAEAIEIAESSDLILELGEFVFRQAAEFARNHSTLSVAINLSPAQFTRSAGFVERLRGLAFEEAINPEQLELEITERMFMDIGSEFESQIQALRRHGFRVALDDFGTGYSSLSYLRRFRVDRLKLDKSFAEDTELYESIAIIRAAVALAHLLGLEVIAEGIETAAHEAIALESGCDGLQGHHYGAAMSAEEFEVYFKERGRKAA